MICVCAHIHVYVKWVKIITLYCKLDGSFYGIGLSDRAHLTMKEIYVLFTTR